MTCLDKLNTITLSSLLTLIMIITIPEYATSTSTTTSPEQSGQDRAITSEGCAEG